MKHPGMDPATLDRLSRRIARKAWELNQRLTEAMSKQNATLATLDLPGEGKPGETPLERLRRYFNLVVAAQKRSRTEDYGLCTSCAEPIAPAILEEMPWRPLCPKCQERQDALAR
jgi:RNA polymerase-binding transcription factor DksA